MDAFAQIWVVDFEFVARPGERPEPVCLVAYELHGGRQIKLWRHEFGPMPPYGIGANSLFVAFYASAELGCHRALGWPAPARILDLFTEFRVLTNGGPTVAGSNLLGALIHFGLDGIAPAQKDSMRDLVLRGGPWDSEERSAILAYCETDVVALTKLLSAMAPQIDLPRALLRGRYMAAVAAMEYTGVPVDVVTLARLREHWVAIQDDLIRAMDSTYKVFAGRTFKTERFERWLAHNDIPWTRLETGQLDLSDEAFRQAAKAHPSVAPLRELRSALSELRLNDLAVDSDGRNRCLLSPFRARSGRNQPSNSRFIFGPSVWLRGLIQPPPGYGIAYVDWAQQEFGIGAALSGDGAMLAAYLSGDPYLAFARQAGAVPPSATKESHGPVRELYKQCVLGTQYGMQAEALAQRIGQPVIVARDLLRAHRETYPKFWAWSDAAVDHAMLRGKLHSVFGWTVRVGHDANPRSLRNFPMQSNGSEMLRIACCLATERGVEVCAPVHDAVLIAAPLDRLSEEVDRMRACMAEASRAVLDGFELRTDTHVVRYPQRYSDARGKVMWDRVCQLVDRNEARAREAA